MTRYVALMTESAVKDRAALESAMADVVAHVTEHEPGTLHFDWGIDEHGTMITYERFVDSAAAMAHFAEFAQFRPRIMPAATLTRLLVFGYPSDELTSMLRGAQPGYFAVQGTVVRDA